MVNDTIISCQNDNGRAAESFIIPIQLINNRPVLAAYYEGIPDKSGGGEGETGPPGRSGSKNSNSRNAQSLMCQEQRQRIQESYSKLLKFTLQ